MQHISSLLTVPFLYHFLINFFCIKFATTFIAKYERLRALSGSRGPDHCAVVQSNGRSFDPHHSLPGRPQLYSAREGMPGVLRVQLYEIYPCVSHL